MMLNLRGTVPRRKSDTRFSIQVFFMNQLPLGPLGYTMGDHFKFLREHKFADIFESKGESPVSTTPAIIEKKFGIGSFLNFC
jgi:hypothetical protein